MSQYPKRLDRSRPHGSYHPPDGGAHYTQDGYDFDHEGYIVEDRLTEEQREKLKKLPKPKPPAPASAKPHHKAEAEPEPEEEADQEEYEDGINLEAWLRGEEGDDFAAVQKAVKARYHVWKTSKRDLVSFLVEDQHLIDPEDLTDEFAAYVA